MKNLGNYRTVMKTQFLPFSGKDMGGKDGPQAVAESRAIDIFSKGKIKSKPLVLKNLVK